MSSDTPVTVVAIDPGTAKCGIALVVDGVDRKVERLIVPTSDLIVTVSQMVRKHNGISIILVGSGTSSGKLSRALRDAVSSVPVLLVDEKGTSLLARDRYFKEHRPSGWKKLLPVSLLVPPEPYDDYAALLLAERYLSALGD